MLDDLGPLILTEMADAVRYVVLHSASLFTRFSLLGLLKDSRRLKRPKNIPIGDT